MYHAHPLGEFTPMLVPGKQEVNKNLPLFFTLLIKHKHGWGIQKSLSQLQNQPI
jgi:hypothetical protein